MGKLFGKLVAKFQEKMFTIALWKIRRAISKINLKDITCSQIEEIVKKNVWIDHPHIYGYDSTDQLIAKIFVSDYDKSSMIWEVIFNSDTPEHVMTFANAYPGLIRGHNKDGNNGLHFLFKYQNALQNFNNEDLYILANNFIVLGARNIPNKKCRYPIDLLSVCSQDIAALCAYR